MSILVDTNVLPRRTQPDHEHHLVAVESVAVLLGKGETLHFTLQNVSEFWNVATRPLESNGLGFSIDLTLSEVEKIERVLTLLPDTPAIYPVSKRLVAQHSVRGAKVHATRLVAAMNVHSVRSLLTFNSDDFVRFGIEVLRPTSVGP
jgi:predicted nucleic acid-binding protein